jgi:hypothetical protein
MFFPFRSATAFGKSITHMKHSRANPQGYTCRFASILQASSNVFLSPESPLVELHGSCDFRYDQMGDQTLPL